MKLNTTVNYLEHLLSNINANVEELDSIHKEKTIELTKITNKLGKALEKRNQLQQELDLLREFEEFKINSMEVNNG